MKPEYWNDAASFMRWKEPPDLPDDMYERIWKAFVANPEAARKMGWDELHRQVERKHARERDLQGGDCRD